MLLAPKTVLFLLLIVSPIFGSRPTVTNEDIRNAILQVVNLVRSTEDKLERHEYRERALGEQLKKAMITLDKRIKMMEPLKGSVSRLDERLAAVETVLIQNDERERIQLQKTFDTVNDIQKNLPIVVENLKEDIVNRLSNAKPPAQMTEPLISKKDFDKLEKELLTKIDSVSKTINNMEKEMSKIRDENKHINEINNKSTENLDKVKRQLDSSEELLEKYENKLAEYNNKIPKIPTINYKEQNEFQKNFMQALDSQKTQVHQILSDIKSVSNKLNQLPNKTDIEIAKNVTLDHLGALRTDSEPKRNNSDIDNKFQALRDDSDKKHEQIKKAITDLSDVTETLTESFGNSYEQIRKEIDELSKVEQIMIQTGDSVMDTKRRIEYGVHQILAEVASQIKESTKSINRALDDRFTNFEVTILDEEQGALANLTSKIGEEIDQVWRQIGIMHQQMSASTDTLNKLQNQTDAYVNGSLNSMDSMKGKVTKVTGRIAEVESDLNFLLGRLSLVTQEFNMIRSGLGKALDEIKESFQAVQKKVKDVGKGGPYKIPDNS